MSKGPKRFPEQSYPREVMRELIGMRMRGVSRLSIAQMMNRKGHTTLRGTRWNPAAVDRVIGQWVRLVFDGDDEYDMMVPLSDHNEAIEERDAQIDMLNRALASARVERDAMRRELARVRLTYERARAEVV